jgi:hypothetical protein
MLRRDVSIMTWKSLVVLKVFGGTVKLILLAGYGWWQRTKKVKHQPGYSPFPMK